MEIQKKVSHIFPDTVHDGRTVPRKGLYVTHLLQPVSAGCKISRNGVVQNKMAFDFQNTGCCCENANLLIYCFYLLNTKPSRAMQRQRDKYRFPIDADSAESYRIQGVGSGLREMGKLDFVLLVTQVARYISMREFIIRMEMSRRVNEKIIIIISSDRL